MNITIHITDRPARQKVALVLWTFGPVREQSITGPAFEVSMTQLTETQAVDGTVKPVTKKGNPAEVQNSVFTSSDPSVLTVTSDPSTPLSVLVKAVAPGAAQVRWTADGDLGDGVSEISAVADFVVTAGLAIGATFAFGTPTEQA